MTLDDRYRELSADSQKFSLKSMIRHHFIRHLKAVRAEAYEDAAKIAATHNGCGDVKCVSGGHCGATIASQIMARAEELK